MWTVKVFLFKYIHYKYYIHKNVTNLHGPYCCYICLHHVSQLNESKLPDLLGYHFTSIIIKKVTQQKAYCQYKI